MPMKVITDSRPIHQARRIDLPVQKDIVKEQSPNRRR